MDTDKLKQKIRKKKVVQINIRITKKLSKWLRTNKYSPTAIFLAGCEEAGYKDE